MTRSIKEVRFELSAVYKTYADQLLASDRVAGMLHDSVDIKGSGNQVETALRMQLSRLLPPKIAVGHGHIVDKTLSVSRQQDIVIAEGLDSKSLIQTLDGTEFFMFESVYCTGEVKRTWSAETFRSTLSSIGDLKTRLNRQAVPPDVYATSPEFVRVPHRLTAHPLRNPLFAFAFAMDFSANVRHDHFRAQFDDTAHSSSMPGVIVILKQGVFLLVNEKKSSGDTVHIELYPEYLQGNKNCRWYFLPETDDIGKNLAFLIFAIRQHIEDALLEKPAVLTYGSDLLDIDTSRLIAP